MAERTVQLDETPQEALQQDALDQATERAEKAEAELARLKRQAATKPDEDSPKANATHAAGAEAGQKTPPSPSSEGTQDDAGGEAELRKDSMMAHLLDSLADGKDIGHYGRLVFAMVARHFMPHAEVLGWLKRDGDFDDEQANLMLKQVEGRDYSPPKRDRILEWQAQQDFPILPHPDDPDCGNLYRNLKFPEAIYKHIGHYQEEKAASE